MGPDHKKCSFDATKVGVDCVGTRGTHALPNATASTTSSITPTGPAGSTRGGSMDVGAHDSAERLRTAVARCCNIVGSHIAPEKAVMAGLVASCRDREDMYLNMFSTSEVKRAILPNVDKLKLSVDEFGALVRAAVRRASSSTHSVATSADMTVYRAQMERALSCTLSEPRQKTHWGNAAVRVAAVLSLHYEDPLDYVDTAVWGTVRADKRRVEDLHERLAHESAPLLLLSSAAEALVNGI